MRDMQDPVRREHALMLYRLGFSHDDVSKALAVSTMQLKKEEAIDAGWHDLVQAAMQLAFSPVLAKAIELAKDADPGGVNEGSIKALDMVMKFYSKALDREHDSAMLDRKLNASETDGPGQGGGILATPEAVERYMMRRDAGPVIEAEGTEAT